MKIIQPLVLPGTSTFSRASAGTYYDKNGLLKTASVNESRLTYNPSNLAEEPKFLLESAATNLLRWTEYFNHSVWNIPLNAPVTLKMAVSPSGSNNANVIDAGWSRKQTANIQSPGQPHTFSIYIKDRDEDSGIAGKVQTEAGYVLVDLFTGESSLVVTNSSLYISYGVQMLPNRWLRVWMTYYAMNATSEVQVTTMYSSFLNQYYLWGAQLEKGLSPTSYISQTDQFVSRAGSARYLDSAGVLRTATSNIARYTYNQDDLPGNPILLLEGAATNYALQSETFDNASWVKTNLTVTANNTAAPDLTVTADKLVATADGGICKQTLTVPSVADTNACTFSVWLKSDLGADILIYAGDSAGGVPAFSHRTVDTTWKRYEVAYVHSGASTTSLFVSIEGLQLGDSVYAWGAQVEVNARQSSSYIGPTTTVSLSRVADVFTTTLSARADDVRGPILSNVPESDYPTHSVTTVYVQGDRIHDPNNHTVYESATGSTSAVTVGVNSTAGMINWAGHGLAVGYPVQFTSTGTLPAPLVANTVYYVNTVINAGSFYISTTNGGATLGITSAGTGTLTARAGINYNTPPSTFPNMWLTVGATNRWSMFDTKVQSQTTTTDLIVVDIALDGRIDTVVLFNIDALTAQVTMTDSVDGVVYDKTEYLVDNSAVQNVWDYLFDPPLRKRSILFTGLGAYAKATLRIILKAPGQTVKCGLCYLGSTKVIGYTQYGLSLSDTDFSVKEFDEFGNAELLQRGYSPRQQTTVWIENKMVDYVKRLLTSYRSTPLVVVTSDVFEEALTYAFYKDFSITISYTTVSECSIEWQGLT
jgi:hypothetical protein